MHSSAPIELLRCPASGQPLHQDSERLVSADGTHVYPVVAGVPILVDTARSIVSVDEVVRSAQHGSTPPSRLRRLADRASWPMATNVSVAAAIPRLMDLVRERAAGAGAGRPRVLVVGGGEVGAGMQPLMDAADIDVISTDIYVSEVVSVACDGHQLPFADASFDGVVIQAVLEHVLEPWTVVAEIHRVLGPGGIVYADTPFMQQVHEGAFDFTRFSELGQRRLFRMFDELDRGVSVGPGVALLWALRYFARALPRDSRAASAIGDRLVALAFGWLQLLDGRLSTHRGAADAASGVYFLGRRSDTAADDRAILDSYRGTMGSVSATRGLVDS